MNALQRRRRGAAAVELAVSMIFLVPLIMYMFFLQDLLAAKLNGQEAAVQAVWDFAVIDMGSAVDRTQVGRMSRLTYCDHTAAFDSFTQDDCDDQKHHKSLAAHECWIGDNPTAYGGQVTCDYANDPIGGVGAVDALKGLQPNSRLVDCRSRLGITNYYLPNKFLTTFRKSQGGGFSLNGDGAKKRYDSRWAVGNKGYTGSTSSAAAQGGQDAVHTDKDSATTGGSGSAGSNFWRLAITHNQMLTDPWALGLEGGANDQPDIDPDNSSGPLHDRVQAAYNMGAIGVPVAMAYGASLVGDSLLSPAALLDGMGDNLATAHTAFKAKDQNQQRFGSHWAAQGGDPRTYRGKLGTGYFYQ